MRVSKYYENAPRGITKRPGVIQSARPQPDANPDSATTVGRNIRSSARSSYARSARELRTRAFLR